MDLQLISARNGKPAGQICQGAKKEEITQKQRSWPTLSFFLAIMIPSDLLHTLSDRQTDREFC